MFKRFNELDVTLSEPVLKTLQQLNFTHATPIQAECIPYLMKNKDVVAEAVTGSGKTVAFLIPLIERLLKRSEPLKKKQVGGLIISPTRELALQTYEVLGKFLENVKTLSSLPLVGGKPILEDVENIRKHGTNIIVGTPGRLEELLTNNFPEIQLPKALKELEMLILDEADKLLNMGFEKSLNTILQYLPTQRRTGLFSATQTRELTSFAKAGLRNPVLIEVKEKKIKIPDSAQLENAATPSNLTSYYMMCEPDKKLAMFVNFIRKKGFNLKYMLFLSSCACVDYFLVILRHILPEIDLHGLHGKMKTKRSKIFDRFKRSHSGILVCTDVMARGVDIPEVDWVIQYDAPSVAASFVHRCGRTARFGHSGFALLMLMPNEDAYPNFILRNQKVVLKKRRAVESNNFEEVIESVRQLQLDDRAVFDKANRAFVSYIKAYSKYECNLILRVKDLDICKLAYGFGLLKLPKMPELKGIDTSSFNEVNIDINEVKYVNQSREKNREQKLQTYQETGVWPGQKKKKRQKQTTPWSESNLRQEIKKERRRKRKELKKQKMAEGNVKKKKRKSDLTEQEMEELMKDVALIKKHKMRKISNNQFDKEFVGSDSE